MRPTGPDPDAGIIVYLGLSNFARDTKGDPDRSWHFGPCRIKIRLVATSDTHVRPARVNVDISVRATLTDAEGLNTTHFSIVDRDGNVVTYTKTVESAWGTGLMVPDYGFLLNNELTDFNRIPAFNPDPANFNPGANDAAAGKRPRSSMSPTIVFDRKKPVVAYGSPGGSSIINSVVNITLDLVDHDRTVQEAVDAPRISFSSSSTTGGTTLYELGFSHEVIEELTGLGHSFSRTTIGSVQAVVINRKGKRQYGAADKRRIGGVVSVRREEIE